MSKNDSFLYENRMENILYYLCIREGDRKTKNFGPVRKRGGGVQPPVQTKIFFSRKEKKVQNVLKWNIYEYIICFDEKIREICSFRPVLCFRLFWIVWSAKNVFVLFYTFPKWYHFYSSLTIVDGILKNMMNTFWLRAIFSIE